METNEYIRKDVADRELCGLVKEYNRAADSDASRGAFEALGRIRGLPAVNAVEVPPTGIDDLSDGFHTFRSLYYQRMILFAALVKAFRSRAWKSYRHEDGEPCFGGGWFVVGLDTPQGSYTYHYEIKDFDLFDCVELPVAKHWDGHTDKDVTRLLSLVDGSLYLANVIVEVKGGMVQSVYADRTDVCVEVADLDVQDEEDYDSAKELLESAEKSGYACVW